MRILIPDIQTAEEWCDFHGVDAQGGVVALFKAVDADFHSSNGFHYRPGTVPVAPDWDGGIEECGGGLHFCARPVQALRFKPDATRFVTCPVALSEIVVTKNAEYPEKIKAPRCCGPVAECDIDGNPIEGSGEGIQ